MPTERERPRVAAAADDAAADQLQEPRVRLDAGPTCPLCLDALVALPQLEVCPTCHTIHHAHCVSEMGRCGTPMCEGFAERSKTGCYEPGSEERLLATLSHALNVLGAAILGPLLIYLISRNKHPYTAHHAQQAFIFSLLMIPVSMTIVGAPIAIALIIRAALLAHRGEWEPFPYAWLRKILPGPPNEADETSVKDAASEKEETEAEG